MNFFFSFFVHGAMGYSQESLMLAQRCHQLLSGFLAKGHLPRLSRQSRLSANDNCDNQMIPGDVHRSPGICLTAEENQVIMILLSMFCRHVNPHSFLLLLTEIALQTCNYSHPLCRRLIHSYYINCLKMSPTIMCFDPKMACNMS